jgi:hypothetical protein
MIVTRLWPAGVFAPGPGLYSQIVSYCLADPRHLLEISSVAVGQGLV